MAVTDEAIEKIKAMIVSGTLRAGDRLPDLGPVTAGEGEPEVRLHQLAHRPGHTLLAIAVGDGGDELAHIHAQLEGLVARSPVFDAVFALATGSDYLPYGSIHADAASRPKLYPPCGQTSRALR